MNDRNNRYVLMNKNTPIAQLTVSSNTVYLTKQINKLPPFIRDINAWVNDRVSPFGRDNIHILMKLAGINNEESYLTISRAISVTDAMWVNDRKYPMTWDEVNPYRNRLSKIMADIAINGMLNYKNQNLKSPSPQYKLDGSINKCVKRCNGKLYLYKTDGERWGDKAGVRPYSEYYASLVARQLGYKWYTNYSIEMYTGLKGAILPFCKCELFTDENIGLIQYGDSKYRDMTLLEFDARLKRIGIKTTDEMRKQLREMLLLDAIIVNPDRHSGNIGLLMNNDTFSVFSMSPIYDNDCSLGALYSIQDMSFDEAYKKVCTERLPKSNTGDYNDTAKIAMTGELYRRLISAPHIVLGKALPGISQNRVDFMEYLVNRRIQEILAMYK
jgi:hypothetical protein